MKDWQSMAHVKWECKYHVVILRSTGGRCCSERCGGR